MFQTLCFWQAGEKKTNIKTRTRLITLTACKSGKEREESAFTLRLYYFKGEVPRSSVKGIKVKKKRKEIYARRLQELLNLIECK